MRMIATGLKVYAGRKLQEGDEFEAEDKDVHVLKLGALARLADEQRDLSAEELGGYLTRDMRPRGRPKRMSH